MKLRSFQQGLPATLLTVALTLPLAAQNTVALNGTSGAETYNTSRTTTGGLTLGLEFQIEYLMVGGGGGGGGAAGSNAGGGGGGQVLTGTASGITNQ